MGRWLAALIVGGLALAARGADVPAGWTVYRSELGGYELAYPPEVTLKAFFDGRSAELADAATGERLADLELWPPDLCPRDRRGLTAERLGTTRAGDVTQADGDDGGSVCGAPIRSRAFRSEHGVSCWELSLTCTSERWTRGGHRHRREGTKGPTFFADVSQPWRTRVLMVDPAGVDPRLARADEPATAPTVVRRILATLRTFAVPDPDVVCIDDLRPAAAPVVTDPARTSPER
jgi:hypothetical protein